MKTLKEIFAEIGHFGSDIGCNDKGGTHSYLETYDKVLEPYRTGCSFMEIGLASGDSIKLFDEYFDASIIIGVDLSIVFERPIKPKNSIRLIASDATKEEFLSHITDDKFDVIIDDASHQTQDQIDTFNLLKDKMNPGGIYIIEDLLALDIERKKYMSLHHNVEIIDLRHIKNRFDDALVIIRF